MITKATVCHAALALALFSPAQAADDLPEFLDKVQLWNFDGHEPTPQP